MLFLRLARMPAPHPSETSIALSLELVVPAFEQLLDRLGTDCGQRA